MPSTAMRFSCTPQYQMHCTGQHVLQQMPNLAAPSTLDAAAVAPRHVPHLPLVKGGDGSGGDLVRLPVGVPVGVGSSLSGSLLMLKSKVVVSMLGSSGLARGADLLRAAGQAESCVSY